MNIMLPIPMFIVRRVVRRNPWLLSNHGTVAASRTLRVGPLELDVNTAFALTPARKARLQAEADAGTLFRS